MCSTEGSVSTELWLIRHASSSLSGSHRWQGWADVGLSPEGKEQAKARREAKEIPLVETVFVSSLRRCIETARIVMPGARLCSDDRLRTRRLGRWQGLTTTEIHREGGVWFHPFAEGSPPGGESLEDVWNRVRQFLSECIERTGLQVVVTHGAIIGLILLKIGRDPLIIPACSFIVLDYETTCWKVRREPSGSVPPV